MKLQIQHPDGGGYGSPVVDSPSVSSAPLSDGRPACALLPPPAAHHFSGISKAIRTIREEYSRPLTIPSLARECGMSVRSLHRRYRDVTGTTIGKDLLARRLKAAAEMLRENDIKLEPLAMETGLRNAKNLCRLFKEYFGLTPGQWKDSHRRSRIPDGWLQSPAITHENSIGLV